LRERVLMGSEWRGKRTLSSSTLDDVTRTIHQRKLSEKTAPLQMHVNNIREEEKERERERKRPSTRR